MFRIFRDGSSFACQQVLIESKFIYLPELKAKSTSKDRVGKKYTEEEIVITSGEYQFEDVSAEEKVGDIVTDILAFYKGHDLLIEIAVTHFIDEEKQLKIQEINKACVEIDLSGISEFTIESVSKMVLKSAPRRWVWSPKYKRVKEKISKSVEAIAEAANHIHMNQCEIHAYQTQKVLERYAGDYLKIIGRGCKR